MNLLIQESVTSHMFFFSCFAFNKNIAPRPLFDSHECDIWSHSSLGTIKKWTVSTVSFFMLCRERESNSHGLPRTILSRVRLPIPPPRQVRRLYTIYCFTKIKRCSSIHF